MRTQFVEHVSHNTNLRNLLAAAVFVEQVSHDIITVKLFPGQEEVPPPRVRDPHPGRTPGGKKPKRHCLT